MTMQIDGNLLLYLRLCEKMCEMVRERFSVIISRTDDLYGMVLQDKKTMDIELYYLDKLTYYDLLETKDDWNIIIAGDDE